jgi:hypothetical protein
MFCEHRRKVAAERHIAANEHAVLSAAKIYAQHRP